MQKNLSLDSRDIRKKGLQLFRKVWGPIFFFALIATIVSNLVSIYFAIFDTFFMDNNLMYLIANISMVIIFLPIVYFSVRLSITNSEKIKTIITKQPYSYIKGFKKSKEKFWKVLTIIIIRSLVKVILIGALVVIGLAIAVQLQLDFVNIDIEVVTLLPFVAVSAIIAIVCVYYLIRIEYASLIVYWDLEIEGSALRGSMALTRYKLFSQYKIMFLAHLPAIFIGVLNLIFVNVGFADSSIEFRWGFIAGSMVFDIIFYPWLQSLYYPIFEQMKVFKQENRIIDDTGREWLTF